MKVKATVKSHFVHGNQPFAEGDTGEFTKAEATDLEKSGLIVIGEDAPAEEDLLGDGEKMAGTPENKMADAPRNKTTVKK